MYKRIYFLSSLSNLNSHRGGKTFSPWWENFFTVVGKLFHRGGKTFSPWWNFKEAA